MSRIKCIITDDEPLARKLISSYVERMPDLELIAECHSARETLELLSKEQIDLIFLDIQMPDFSGMTLAKSINPKTRVIFTTAFDQYAIEGYKVNAVDYLLKPFSFEEFTLASQKAIALIRDNEQSTSIKVDADYILIKADYKIFQLKLENIQYIEGVKDYVKIYSINEPKPLMPLMSMKSLSENLPQDRFMRVHRSYIVNLNLITVIERNQIVFGETRITVSNKYRSEFQSFLDSRFSSK